MTRSRLATGHRYQYFFTTTELLTSELRPLISCPPPTVNRQLSNLRTFSPATRYQLPATL